MKRLRTILQIAAMMLPIMLMISCNNDNDVIGDGLNPTVSTTNPMSNETEVVRNKMVTVTFSKEMDSSTINTSTFTLTQGTTNITGTVEYSGLTATFTSARALLATSDYTATITSSVKSSTGEFLASDYVWNFKTGGSAIGIENVFLGTSADFVILAKSAINNTGTSAVTGDLGISPAATTYITGLTLTDFTGYATSDQVTGKVYAADMADPTPVNLTTAVENMITAYNDAAGRLSPDFSELGTGNLGGSTLTSGLYKWTTTVNIPSDLTISGSDTDVWIFQIAGNLSLSSDVNVILSGGAQANNIFWQIAGEATLGTNSHFEGVILSMTGITFQTGASFNGSAFAQTAVTLDGNDIVQK